MREIEFKGKRVYVGDDEDNWVYGFFIKGGLSTYIFDNTPEINDVLVIPETVGEYTGVKDKSGKKIFEGDIVKNTRSGSLGTIIFEDGFFALRYEGHENTSAVVSCMASELVVVGNIHDNNENNENEDNRGE